MKKRTFFATLLLFTLFFNASILLISVITLKDNLDVTRGRCLAEHYIIATSLLNDIKAMEDRGRDAGSSMTQLMLPYTRYSQNKLMELAVSKEEKWIFQSNASMNLPSLQRPDIVHDTPRQVTVDSGRSPALSIYGRFPSPYQDYGILYRYDLSDTIASWRKLKNMLFLAGAGVTLLLACSLRYLLNVVFRPLNQITDASRNIAAGHYEQRLPDTGRDEIAAMAHSFNIMAQEVEGRIEQLRRSAEQKQQFIDNFAHELRTPLTAVYGYAEYIQKAVISEEDKYSSTEFIMSECRRLQNMAGQLLELATLRTDEIAMEPIRVSALLQKVCTAMRPKAEKFQIALSIQDPIGNIPQEKETSPLNGSEIHECSKDSSLIITGNPELLESLLCNLIDNALKASHPNGQIQMLAFPETNGPAIAVRDDGIGMLPEQLSHITEAFYRADKARSRKLGGAGLGLSICESIAELHHAKLGFKSSPGKGTEVTIYFLQVDNNFVTV